MLQRLVTRLKVINDENSGDILMASFSGKDVVRVIIQLLCLIIVFAVPAEKDTAETFQSVFFSNVECFTKVSICRDLTLMETRIKTVRLDTMV